ncbi:MAG: MAPEG family protein [Pseudomonadota bacterium]
MPLPVTAVFAGILGLWLIYLQMQVGRQRRTKGILLGSGGDADCERTIRAHGNATETIPIFLILMAAGESLATPVWVLAVLGAVFTLGRFLHGVHFLRNSPGLRLRFWGMIMTVLATALMALGAIGHGLGSML